MATDRGLTGPERVQKLQNVLHEKAKEDPKRRAHSPGDEDQELSVGEGMIPVESRMPENGTSGLMSGGEETQLRRD